jgi:transposase
VKLLADGWTVSAVSRWCELSRPAVYKWPRRYLEQRKVEALADKPRSGRPPTARGLTGELLAQEVRKSPHQLDYTTHGWTVALLATPLRWHFGVEAHTQSPVSECR